MKGGKKKGNGEKEEKGREGRKREGGWEGERQKERESGGTHRSFKFKQVITGRLHPEGCVNKYRNI